MRDLRAVQFDGSRQSFSPAPIELANISKSFGALKVLDSINLSIASGEVLAAIGPSGSGKSTLLRCINFLERPDAGSVTVGDFELKGGELIDARKLRRLRSRLGMVFQSFNLFPHMTVLRNVSLPQQRVLGRTREESDEISIQILKRVGVEQKANQYPLRCSGGQQQRVAIARALALGPSAMLFDEPTSALDPELGLEVLKVMRELAESGMTMIVVTHEMGFAKTVSDRVAIMVDGKVLEYGPSRQVIEQPSTERARAFLRAVNDR